MKLTKMYAEARNALVIHGEEGAREGAIWLLNEAGYESDSVDTSGQPVGGEVQSHLMIALMRAPKLADLIERLEVERLERLRREGPTPNVIKSAIRLVLGSREVGEKVTISEIARESDRPAMMVDKILTGALSGSHRLPGIGVGYTDDQRKCAWRTE